jgi:hypothetical protein
MYPGRMNGQGMHPSMMGQGPNGPFPPGSVGQSDGPSMSPRTDKTNISKFSMILNVIHNTFYNKSMIQKQI